MHEITLRNLTPEEIARYATLGPLISGIHINPACVAVRAANVDDELIEISDDLSSARSEIDDLQSLLDEKTQECKRWKQAYETEKKEKERLKDKVTDFHRAEAALEHERCQLDEENARLRERVIYKDLQVAELCRIQREWTEFLGEPVKIRGKDS